MTALADQLLESFLADQGSVAELLDRRSGELTEDLAAEFRARSREALDARDGT